MSKLIDADALIELIESGTDLEFDEVTEKALVQMINEQDIAFDVEKVVAGLEIEANLQGYFRQDACKKLNVEQGNIHRYAEQCYQNAIDIVREGGIE